MTVKITGVESLTYETWRIVYDATKDYRTNYSDRQGRNDSVVYTYRVSGDVYHVEVYQTKTMVVAKITEGPEQRER